MNVIANAALAPDRFDRGQKIIQLMKDAHYELSQAAFLLQWGNYDTASRMAHERAGLIFDEIEALKNGAPL